MKIRCAHCRRWRDCTAGRVNRSRKIGAPLYCDRHCAGLARRKHKTKAQKIEEKRIYDIAYRMKNADRLRAEKAAYYQRTRDPAKEAAYRKAHMARHVEYCRRPDYRDYKQQYDKLRRAAEFGQFSECFLLLQDLDAEIASRMSAYEIRVANGYYQRKSAERRQRRRENASAVSY